MGRSLSFWGGLLFVLLSTCACSEGGSDDFRTPAYEVEASLMLNPQEIFGKKVGDYQPDLKNEILLFQSEGVKSYMRDSLDVSQALLETFFEKLDLKGNQRQSSILEIKYACDDDKQGVGLVNQWIEACMNEAQLKKVAIVDSTILRINLEINRVEHLVDSLKKETLRFKSVEEEEINSREGYSQLVFDKQSTDKQFADYINLYTLLLEQKTNAEIARAGTIPNIVVLREPVAILLKK